MKPLGANLSRVARTSLLVGFLLGGSVALNSPIAAQVATGPAPVPVFASGPLPLRGPDADQRLGETAELCAVNLSSKASPLTLELRDATKLGDVLTASGLVLDAGKGACIEYTESTEGSRRVVVGVVLTASRDTWRTASRSVAATTVVRDGAGKTVSFAQASPKVATFPLELRSPSDQPVDLAEGSTDRQGALHLALPRPVQVAGPLPLDAILGAASDTLEVCATNVALTNVEYTLTIVDSLDTSEVLASLRGALGPGEGTCLPYTDAQLSRRVIAVVSPVGGASPTLGSTWGSRQRSFVSLASIKDGTSNTILVGEMHPLLAFLPAVQ